MDPLASTWIDIFDIYRRYRDIKTGNAQLHAEEGYRQDSDLQKARRSREALAQLLKVAESRVRIGTKPKKRNASAKQTWELVKDFFNLHKWFPTMATCYTSAVSVIQYTNCEDLMNQFIQASTEVSEGTGSVAIELAVDLNDEEVTPNVGNTAVNDKATDVGVVVKDDVYLAKLSECRTPAPNKGKRKVNAKKTNVLYEHSNKTKGSSVHIDEPLAKVIKQEKK